MVTVVLLDVPTYYHGNASTTNILLCPSIDECVLQE